MLNKTIPLAAVMVAVAAMSGAAVMAQPNSPNRTSQSDNRNDRDRTDRDRSDQGRDAQGSNDQGSNDQGRNNRGSNNRGSNNRGRNAQSRNDQSRNDQDYNRFGRDDPSARFGTPRWSRGDRVPDQYRENRYVVNDWRQRSLRRPPRGQSWVSYDNSNYFLMMSGTGIITDVFYRGDRDQRWRQRYSQNYTFNDDTYYQTCRSTPDPVGVIAGALIGGLFGNAAGRGDGGATIAGVIAGGALGAAMTRNLDCEDQSYAYQAYYDGFNSDRPNSVHRWRNPGNGHYGNFRVVGYANDPDGFRCANFSQQIYVNARPQASTGRACQQPDGTWAIIG